MSTRDWSSYIALLKREVVPALGCTEPSAVALAAAKAAEVLGQEPESLEVFLSRDVLKNGMSVGVPGTGMFGLEIATAAGAFGGNPDLGLEVLAGLSEDNVAAAKDFLNRGKLNIQLKEDVPTLYIEVIAHAGSSTTRVIIQNRHTNICFVEKNGTVFFESKSGRTGEEEWGMLPDNMTERDIWEFSNNAPLDELRFILQAAELNIRISEEGLSGEYGLKLGHSMDEYIRKGILVADLSTEAVRRTVGGIDARMAGSNLPVMSNSGSGNQGITATIPVVVVADRLGSSEGQLVRGLILSHLTSIYIKSRMDRISALCGALVAAIGASCGIVYLLGGTYEHTEFAIKNMVGNVSGMICDGAKKSCSLKVSSCVSAAVQGALLALDSVGVSGIEGIVEEDIEKTIKNLGELGTSGMHETDKWILDIMTSKKQTE